LGRALSMSETLASFSVNGKTVNKIILPNALAAARTFFAWLG
jgi:hypothetical protein